MIRIEKLTQSYCLNDINCTLPSGKLIGIMGANGAGKSTLLKTIAGILPLKQGEVWFDNQPLSKMNATEKSHHIAYLAQNTQIHWDLSVYDVIALGLAAPLPKEKERSKLTALFYSINRINYALSPINTDSNAISIISLKVN